MRILNVFEGGIAALATIVTGFFEGWDVAIKLLATLIILDYVTGFIAAAKHKKLNLDVMWWGGIRKGVVFMVIIVAVLLDEMLNNSNPVMRTLVIY